MFARRPLIAFALLAFVALTGCDDSTPKTAEPTKTDLVTEYGAYTPEWARLVYRSHAFQAAVVKEHERNDATYAFATTPVQVSQKVGYASEFAPLTDYTGTETGFRYCVSAANGPFYAATVSDAGTTDESQVTIMGFGDCNYTKGVVYIHEGDVRGQDFLDLIKFEYDKGENTLIAEAPLKAVFDGKNVSVADEAVDAAVAIDTAAARDGARTETLTTKDQKALGIKFTGKNRLGYYDYREQVGYRVCVTDGIEEAIFEWTTERQDLVRHSQGTCNVT